MTGGKRDAYQLISYLCPISLYQKKNSYRIVSNRNKSGGIILDLVGISALLCILQDNFETGKADNKDVLE